VSCLVNPKRQHWHSLIWNPCRLVAARNLASEDVRLDRLCVGQSQPEPALTWWCASGMCNSCSVGMWSAPADCMHVLQISNIDSWVHKIHSIYLIHVPVCCPFHSSFLKNSLGYLGTCGQEEKMPPNGMHQWRGVSGASIQQFSTIWRQIRDLLRFRAISSQTTEVTVRWWPQFSCMLCRLR